MKGMKKKIADSPVIAEELDNIPIVLGSLVDAIGLIRSQAIPRGATKKKYWNNWLVVVVFLILEENGNHSGYLDGRGSIFTRKMGYERL